MRQNIKKKHLCNFTKELRLLYNIFLEETLQWVLTYPSILLRLYSPIWKVRSSSSDNMIKVWWWTYDGFDNIRSNSTYLVTSRSSRVQFSAFVRFVTMFILDMGMYSIRECSMNHVIYPNRELMSTKTVFINIYKKIKGAKIDNNFNCLIETDVTSRLLIAKTPISSKTFFHIHSIH